MPPPRSPLELGRRQQQLPIGQALLSCQSPGGAGSCESAVQRPSSTRTVAASSSQAHPVTSTMPVRAKAGRERGGRLGSSNTLARVALCNMRPALYDPIIETDAMASQTAGRGDMPVVLHCINEILSPTAAIAIRATTS
ncbi:hypothetical protein SCUP515_00813 [Seiridium cupressi]